MNVHPENSNNRDFDDARLTAYALGQLEESERAEVQRWLAEADGARAAEIGRIVEEIRAVAGQVVETARQDPGPPPSPALREAIERHFSTLEQSADADAPSEPSPASTRRPIPRRWSVLAAAACLLGLVVPAAIWMTVRSTGARHDMVAFDRSARSPAAIKRHAEASPSAVAESAQETPTGTSVAGRDWGMAESDADESGVYFGRANGQPPFVPGLVEQSGPDAAGPAGQKMEVQVQVEMLEGTVAEPPTVAPEVGTLSGREDGRRKLFGRYGGVVSDEEYRGVGQSVRPSSAKNEGKQDQPASAAEPARRMLGVNPGFLRGRTMSRRSDSKPPTGAGDPAAKKPEPSPPESRLATKVYSAGDLVVPRKLSAGGAMGMGGGMGGATVIVDQTVPGTEQYDRIVENEFLSAAEQPVSTFSIDVDTASYANVRRFLVEGRLPPPDAVRVEEMVNYFPYDYPEPDGEHPFSVNMEVAECPWNGDHRLARIGLKGRPIHRLERGPSSLVTIAKDVKIQIEFNPAEVDRYRLIGYENRLLRAKDFANDKKDAGEIGAGHTVTALYEIVPVGGPRKGTVPFSLRENRDSPQVRDAQSGEVLTLRLRYKHPQGNTSELVEHTVRDTGKRFGEASADFRFSAAVASFGMTLRGSPHAAGVGLAAVEEFAAGALDKDPEGYRSEFVDLVRRARATYASAAARAAQSAPVDSMQPQQSPQP